MAIFSRQVWTLVVKDLKLAFIRRWLTTTLRALLLPMFLVGFLTYTRNLFVPPSIYGVGTPTPIKPLADAMNAVPGGRSKVVFVHSGYKNGSIHNVIREVTRSVEEARKTVQVLADESALAQECRGSLRGVSSCIVAAVFHSSPEEGPAGTWDYTIRADPALSGKILVESRSNDAQIYVLPFQHAIDEAIATSTGLSDQMPVLEPVHEYPYTSKTEEERKEDIRISSMNTLINILAVTFYIPIAAISYQLTGFVATERELGMTQLIDCMAVNPRWSSLQTVRVVSHHFAFDAIYFPGWAIAAIVVSLGVFPDASLSIIMAFHILAGLSTTSFSLCCAAMFKKSQLSSAVAILACLGLGVLAQALSDAHTVVVTILSCLFPPMTYVYFFILLARWGKVGLGVDLLERAPGNPWSLPGVVFLAFLALQVLGFAALAVFLERWIHGHNHRREKASSNIEDRTAVTLKQVSLAYSQRNWLPVLGSQKRFEVLRDVNLTAIRGEILAIVGTNGSGKSTMLNIISGILGVGGGEVETQSPRGSRIGLCPQKNVLWDDLTVEEHVRIFSRLKSVDTFDSLRQLGQVIHSCDLASKLTKRSKTLSGGQKRKLQLAMMLTGGSNVCCVDEVSSGLDPISRRKVWDILLSERGNRTFILTTHFLDEADLLSDNVAVLYNGTVRAQGSSAELKGKFGAGWRVTFPHNKSIEAGVHPGCVNKQHFGKTVLQVSDAQEAAVLLSCLHRDGMNDYSLNGPTFEDVFMDLVKEPQAQVEITEKVADHAPANQSIDVETKDDAQMQDLCQGTPTSLVRQCVVLFCKRLTILRRNYLPHLAALTLSIVGSGLVTLLVNGADPITCMPPVVVAEPDIPALSTPIFQNVLLGVSSVQNSSALFVSLAESIPDIHDDDSAQEAKVIQGSVIFADSLATFYERIELNYSTITPGGAYVAEVKSAATFAWRGDGDMSLAVTTQNILDVLRFNQPITTRYQSFDRTFTSSIGDALQLTIYFGFIMVCYPAFFSLYPTAERLKKVRTLQYSNGVRQLPLWLSYTQFDFVVVVIISTTVVIVFRAVSNIWYHLEYLYAILLLFGLASTLFSYVISLWVASQLAAFATVVAIQSLLLVAYFVGHLAILTYAAADKVNSYITIVHFVVALISPGANLLRSMFVMLNLFSITCNGNDYISYPGDIEAYGGPILYLTLQSIGLFGLILFWDHTEHFENFLQRLQLRSPKSETQQVVSDDIAAEVARVSESSDGLKVLHVTKVFGRETALEDVTFGVPHSEIFGLLGPNGAGKSTLISLVRGDFHSFGNDRVQIEGTSISKNPRKARAHLGVCPQFDALEEMTVLEHLRFFARIRGVSDVDKNVRTLVNALGLMPHAHKLAHKLSGGNKRKLSLAIALTGHPTVLLLDEPSSGMDPVAKRSMWRALSVVMDGRSVLLTTHSMEEADVLARRIGVLDKRMLTIGDPGDLRKRYGNTYHVHVVRKDAPNTGPAEMDNLCSWIRASFSGAVIERKPYAGQVRFQVPGVTSDLPAPEFKPGSRAVGPVPGPAPTLPSDEQQTEQAQRPCLLGELLMTLEANLADLGLEYYAVNQTALDQVFFSIVQGNRQLRASGDSVV